MKNFRFFTMLVVFVLAIAACAPTAPPAGSTTPTSVPPTPLATIPPADLVQKNHLTICSDFPYAPQEFYDENGNPQGMDIDIGKEIGTRLGLQTVFVNSVFDSIILAVTGGKCDIIISAMNITSDRQKQVSMIPYFIAGQSLVVLKGNPNNITGPMDLCGKSVAAESGTTEAFWLQGTSDYEGKGLTQECTAAGKEAPTVVLTQKDSDALLQLQANKVAAYDTDTPVAANDVSQNAGLYEIVGQVIEPIQEGIAMGCGQADCTNAPLSPVGQAVKTALDSMMKDGTYTQILTKWNLTSGAITP